MLFNNSVRSELTGSEPAPTFQRHIPAIHLTDCDFVEKPLVRHDQKVRDFVVYSDCSLNDELED
jgi:hypothetical protein